MSQILPPFALSFSTHLPELLPALCLLGQETLEYQGFFTSLQIEAPLLSFGYLLGLGIHLNEGIHVAALNCCKICKCCLVAHVNRSPKTILLFSLTLSSFLIVEKGLVGLICTHKYCDMMTCTFMLLQSQIDPFSSHVWLSVHPINNLRFSFPSLPLQGFFCFFVDLLFFLVPSHISK